MEGIQQCERGYVMSKGARKGSGFERDLCKQFSLWWTGDERDDVFWRTSGSGGRASVRGKRGVSTYTGHGDMLAVDPIGEPLIRLCCFEFKRGYNAGLDLSAIVDAMYSRLDLSAIVDTQRIRKNTISHFWEQAEDARKLSNAHYSVLITKRDYRQVLIHMPIFLWMNLCAEAYTMHTCKNGLIGCTCSGALETVSSISQGRVVIYPIPGEPCLARYAVSLPLDIFLHNVTPEMVEETLERLETKQAEQEGDII